MDLEVIGRHALLFDDDSNAAFVNSGDALVEWHSLQIDRYDVRHLLPAPPPSRRRNRSSEAIHLDDPSLQSQLDYERYLDLILQPDQPDQPGVEEDERPLDTGGYRAVAFSYGNSDDSVNQNNAAVAVESSAFHPPFPIPGDIQSLPQTEKIHQIVARTAIFVSKHGGQSEIILRVKQGDNPTFGFLMPDHQLHAYFRYLVEHPNLLNSDEQKEGKSIDGALSLLGSVYGSGEEEEEGDGIAKTEKNVVNHTVSQGSNKIESKADSNKEEESVCRNSILSSKENTIAVKKNSLVTASKSGSVKGIKKDDKSGRAKNAVMEEVTSSKVEPLILEPPPELKRIIDKLVEFIVRNGKQFEATLIEQDSKDGRFPFLLPTNQYHSYYLKVLQSAQQSKVNGRISSYSEKANNNLSCLPPSAASCIPLEIDRKEKFKMAIGKSKEAESRDREPVDAETAAAILQAATRGIKHSNIQMISTTSATTNSHANNSQGNHVSGLPKSKPDNCAGSSEEQLTEEQKLKAERLKRAKMFVAMLKRGTIGPHKQGTSRNSSVESPHSGAADVNLNGKEREGSLAPDTFDRPATDEKPEERNYFDEHIEPLSKRMYRPRFVKCEEDDSEEHDEVQKDHDDRLSKRKRRSRRSRRYEEDDEHEDSIEMEEKHHKKRHRPHSSSDENSYEDKNHKRSRKKHHSSHKSLRKRPSSKQHSDSEEEDEHDDKERDHNDSSKKPRSHRSSHCSKNKHNRHRDKRSSREEKSRRKRKHHSSSDDEHGHHSQRILDKDKRGLHGDGNELEEGEISSKVAAGQSRDIGISHINRETSVDVAEVPNDLRAKVRAMLIATRLS